MSLTSRTGHVRKTLAAGIVAALGSHAADAAVFNVTNTNDSGAGSLRDALIQANGNMEADTIDLSAISGQTIILTSGALYSGYDDITINGAGVTIDADGNSSVLYAYESDVTINNLTITGGSSYYGGGIQAKYGSLTLNDSVVTGNSAAVGGGMAVFADNGVSINRSQITGNTAYEGGGLYLISYDNVNLIDSVISGNTATFGGNPESLPRPNRMAERLDERFSSWRDTRLGGLLGKGGGVFAGGGILGSFGDVIVSGTSIAGNSSDGDVGGLAVFSPYGNVGIESSTISGNQAVGDLGGGAALAKYELRIRNSTISGNIANGDGGGFAAYAGSGGGNVNLGVGGGIEVLALEFVTVTNNSSATSGGGLSLSSYGSLDIVASTIAGNTAPVDPDINFVEPSQTADVAFSLIGVDPSTGTLNKDAVSLALTGQDPLLGPLADNGGPTLTHLPAGASPLVDAIPPGEGGCGTTVAVDQRGEARPTGPGCDIGALELTGTPPPVIPEARAVPVLDRIGLAVMAGLVGLLGLFGIRRRL